MFRRVWLRIIVDSDLLLGYFMDAQMESQEIKVICKDYLVIDKNI